MIIPDELVHELIGKEQSISFCLWKQLPDHAVQMLVIQNTTEKQILSYL